MGWFLVILVALLWFFPSTRNITANLLRGSADLLDPQGRVEKRNNNPKNFTIKNPFYEKGARRWRNGRSDTNFQQQGKYFFRTVEAVYQNEAEQNIWCWDAKYYQMWSSMESLTMNWDAAKKHCHEKDWKWTLDLIDKYQKEMEELKDENLKLKRQLVLRSQLNKWCLPEFDKCMIQPSIGIEGWVWITPQLDGYFSQKVYLFCL